MCLAICSPENTTIPFEALQQGFKINDDGAGFAYAKDDKLNIVKGFTTFEDFWGEYQKYQELATIVHFRITTHGETNEENMHPFSVGKNLCMIHNGIINAVDRPDKTKSDTYWFNQKILVPVYKRDSRFIFKDHFKELIKEYIGWSKLVFLNNKGHHTIVNEDKGVWDDGIWYSNTSYKPRQVHGASQQQSRQQAGAERRRIVPFTDKKESNQELFVVGSRVKVEYTHNKGLNGEGVVEYFTGGQMVGVKMDGQESCRLIHLSFLFPIEVKNIYAKDDWVVKKDDPNVIGEVQGIVGSGVIVRWLGGTGMFVAPDYVVSADKLMYWHSYGDVQ